MTSPDYVLRKWAGRQHWLDFKREPAGYKYPESEGATHVLEFDNGSRIIKVWFTEVIGFPDLMRIRSQNWRVEHEPSGFISRVKARQLYRQCLDAGMRKVHS